MTAASVAYGTYGIGKGLWSLGRGILSGTSEISAVARTGATAQRATTASKAAALPEGHMWQRCSPFKDKAAAELHEMFLKKGFEAKRVSTK